MILNETKTVRDVVLEMPAATRIFEKMKIDYCCGGERPLAEACAAAGVDIEEVARLLEQAEGSEQQTGAENFQSAPLSELVKHILDKHHVFTKQEIERLDALIKKVCSVHAERHPELLRINDLFQKLCDDLRPHMFKEEQILFPYIMQMEEAIDLNRAPMSPPFGTVSNPVRMMMSEHDRAGALLHAIREASGDFAVPEDGCISYETLYKALEGFEADLHQHIHLENNILFPRTVEMESRSLV